MDQMAFSQLLTRDFSIGISVPKNLNRRKISSSEFNLKKEIEESLCAEKRRQNSARERERIASINEYYGVLRRAVRPFIDDESCGVPKVSRLN